MNRSVDVEIASFYPNLGSLIEVKVNGAEPSVFSTNDYMTANDEVRHYIDEHYLHAFVPGGKELQVVDPNPPCTKLGMARNPGGEVVLGMLEKRLAVACFNPKNSTWLQVKLRNVLVVRNMPVPIHISLMNLLARGNRRGRDCALQPSTKQEACLLFLSREIPLAPILAAK